MIFQGRCYDCFRPRDACFCHSIPTIDNQTELLILQHRREQFHPFNTARIVRKALRNSQLLAGHLGTLAGQLRLKPRAGLLYPGPEATLLSDLPTDQRPEQLVVVDGTWHHAKTMVRDIPILQTLPRYRLAPSSPGRYRIRLEPNATALSTVEAVVAALQVLEPQTDGFDRLLDAFATMVEGQLARLASSTGSHFQGRPNPTWKNIPRVLHGNLDQIVVAYGEVAEGELGRKRVAEPPVVWVAQRLGDGANFGCTLIPPRPLSDEFLGHLELSRSDFDRAATLREAQRRWAEFQLPGDQMVVVKPGTARLFAQLAGDYEDCLVLKAIDMQRVLRDSIAELPPAPSLALHPPPALGRAGKRLADAIAMVLQLHALAGWRR